MPAELLTINERPHAHHPDDAHYERLKARFRRAYDQVSEVIPLNPAASLAGEPVFEMYSAGCRWAEFSERRATHLKRALEAVLSSDFVNDEQRAMILAVLKGKHGVGRDPKLLTPAEAEIVQGIRALSPKERAAALQVIRWATGASQEAAQ